MYLPLFLVTSLFWGGAVKYIDACVEGDPAVFDIYPRNGGTQGEVRITVNGRGFSPGGQFSLNDPDVGNEVFLVSDLATLPCSITTAEAHMCMIICYTAVMEHGTSYTVKVKVDGEMIPDDQYCSNPNNCKYYANDHKTPYIETMADQAAPQGAMFEFYGKLFTSRYDATSALSTNGEDAFIRRVYAGPQTCELKDPLADEPYGIELRNEGSSAWGTLYCMLLNSNFVGLMNISFIVSDEFGRSRMSPQLLQVSATNRLYTLQTYATITSVAMATGSVEGGSVLRIQGNSFDPANTQVSIEGVECEVLSVSLTEVLCTTPPEPETRATYFPGNRGVLWETWNETYFSFADIGELETLQTDALDYRSRRLEKFGWSEDAGNKQYVSRVSAYFVPPWDDDYRFYLKSDDGSVLNLSPTGPPEDKEEIASCPSNTGVYTTHDTQISEAYTLEEGKSYYLEALFQQGWGSSNLYVGVEMSHTVYTAAHTGIASNEIQQITMDSTIVREKQVITFPDSSLTAEQEVQVVTVTGPDSAVGSSIYRLQLFNTHTVKLVHGASSTDVKNAINDIPALDGDTVQVTMDVISGGFSYTVTFQSERGDFPEIGYRLEAGSEVSVSVSTTTEGRADSGSFSLMMDGIPSAPIAFSANAAQVSGIITGMFEARCPDFIVSQNSYNREYFQSFESTEVDWSDWGEVTTETSFCGHRSLKNSEFLFQYGNNDLDEISLFTYGTVCFAYKGAYLPKIELYFVRNTWWQTKWRHYDTDLINDGSWHYKCIDMFALVQDEFGTVDYLGLRHVKLFNDPEQQHVDEYVDVAFVGRIGTTDDDEGTPLMVTPAATANGDLILEVGVDIVPGDTSTDYTIEFIPVDCIDTSVPLFQVMGTELSATVTRESTATRVVTGTFDLTVNDVTLSDLSVETEADELKLLLETIEGVGVVKVTREGTCADYRWIVEWITNGGNHPEMQISGSLTGTDAVISIITIQEGGLFFKFIPGEFLRVSSTEPQVQMTVNDIPVACEGVCAFNWAEAATPELSSLSDTSGSSGTGLTISGTNMDAETSATWEETKVLIGGEECEISSNTATEIMCAIGTSPVGTHVVEVVIQGKGLARHPNSGALEFTVIGQLQSVDPATGSERGGMVVTLSGTGFNSGASATIGGENCAVQTATPNEITCTVPARVTSAADESTVEVTVNEIAFGSSGPTFTYNTDPMPYITSLSETSAPAVGGGTLDIMGSNFGASADATAWVKIGEVPVTIATWTDSQITVELGPHEPGTFPVSVRVDALDMALPGDGVDADFDFVFSVTNLYPATGSLYGGTRLTITGEGFSTNQSLYDISLGDTDCEVDSATTTEITCLLDDTAVTHHITNDGVSTDFGTGYAWLPAILTIEEGDTVNWRWEAPPLIVNMNYRVFQTTSATGDIDENGFSSGESSTPAGSFAHRFYQAGTYYYSSGMVDMYGAIYMRGVIHVNEKPATRLAELHMTMAELSPLLSPGGSDPTDSSGCSDTTAPISGCTDAAPSGDPSLFELGLWSCASPVITERSPSDGVASTTLTITGTGFSSDNCANEVMVGDRPCDVTSSSDTQLECSIDHGNSLAVAMAHYVTVRVKNFGYAAADVGSPQDLFFVMYPHIESISPSSGSEQGGTIVTISGAGYTSLPMATNVMIGTTPCDVTSVTYQQIQCRTQSAGMEKLNEDVVVTLTGGVETRCPSESCTFSFASADTPAVTSISTSANSGPDILFTLSGTGFGTDINDITVTVGDEECVVQTTDITCELPYGVVGDQEISVHIATKGYATLSSPSVTIDPYVASISPDTGGVNGGSSVVINGGGFLINETTVTVNGLDCPVTDMSISSVTCTTPANPSGSYDLVVTSNDINFPAQTYTYDEALTPSVSSIDPTSGNGGDTLTIHGTGFTATLGDNVVMLAGKSCTVTSADTSSIECLLPVLPAEDHDVIVQVEGVGQATSSSTFTAILSVNTVTPSSGSLGGGQVATVSGKGFDAEDTQVTICGEICEIIGSPTGAELQCVTPMNTGSGTVPCDVTVNTLAVAETLTSGYNYESSLTPVISSVNPRRGGTGGGTSVTIDGTGFGNTQDSGSVTIATESCTVVSWSDTEIVCTTAAISASVETNVIVDIENKGNAWPEDANFRYIDVWSSPFTWGGGSPPGEGQMVVITENQTILLDTDTEVLAMLLIRGGTLMFDDDQAHIELHAENILIMDGGTLQVGTHEEPYMNEARIMMHGDLRSPELPLYGSKTLALREGFLELHGRPTPVTWTTLAETAPSGSSTLQLSVPVNWRAGDLLGIATTGHRHTQNENELRTIASVSADGLTLTLTEALEYEHISQSLEFDDEMYHFKAEIGLLSHNIRFEGSRDLAWSDVIEACPDGFNTGEFATQTCFQGRFGEEMGSDQNGAQIMIGPSRPDEHLAVAHIEYIEATYTGQAFRLGRYAIHFHLMGDMSRSYVRGCGIHESFNRAVNIHASNYGLIENNVIYNIMGGAFFLEDGVEIGNTFQYNLAIFVIASTSLLNDDITPAAYWLTNSNNTIQHNNVAGGTHFGFWYRLHAHSDGPSYSSDYCPQRMPMGIFRNNTVHSNGWFGLWVFQFYWPTSDGACGGGQEEAAVFEDLTAWNCEKAAEWVTAGPIQFKGIKSFNMETAGIEAKDAPVSEANRFTTGGAMIQHCLIVGKVDELPSNTEHPVGIKLPQHSGLVVDDVVFVDLDEGHALQLAVIAGTCHMHCGIYTSQFSQIRWINTQQRAFLEYAHQTVYEDTDGSLTGASPGTRVLPSDHSSLGLPTSCVPGTDAFHAPDGVPAVFCPSDVNLVRFSFNDVSPSSLMYKNALFTNEFGTMIGYFESHRKNHPLGYIVGLVAGYHYTFQFQDAESIAISNFTFNGLINDIRAGGWITLGCRMDVKPDYATIAGRQTTGLDTPLSYDTAYNGDWYYDPFEHEFTFIISDRHAPEERKRRSVPGGVQTIVVNLEAVKCFYPDCEPPPAANMLPPPTERPESALFWSQSSAWQSFGQSKPGSNDLVVIPTDVWMVLDEAVPNFFQIHIFGTLEVDSTDFELELNAEVVYIRGGRLIAGFQDNLFTGDFTLTLRGSHSSDIFMYPDEDDGPIVGAKALANFGAVDLHGLEKTPSWTRLSATAQAGASSITVTDAVNWQVGDEIVITTTSYSSWQTETFSIQSISGGGRTLTLNGTLQFKHLGSSYTVEREAGTVPYTMAAEVGVLTRNIRIQGEDYADLYPESFGARVLVSSMVRDGEAYTGYARIENVEFYHTGQEGYTQVYDSRTSINYFNVGPVSDIRPSMVRSCAFHNGFSPAISVVDGANIPIVDTVTHHTVGPGIVITGEGMNITRNLVTLCIWPGSYQDRYERGNQYYYGGIEIVNALGGVMHDNVVAGSEKGGYKLGNRPCPTQVSDDDIWQNNLAHGVMHGVLIMPEDAEAGICIYIPNFEVHRAVFHGIYVQSVPEIWIINAFVVDARIGALPLIYMPPALTHEREDKRVRIENSVFIGRSPEFDCELDQMDYDDHSVVLSGPAWAITADRWLKNHVGVLWSMFMSSQNSPTFMGFQRLGSYPTIAGATFITDCTFVNFGSTCGTMDHAIETNVKGEDALHPITVTNTERIDVPQDNLMYMNTPDPGMANPSDCVDMSCDGLKKLTLTDVDGKFMGGAPGAMVSYAEYEWDGDPSHGVGDYRIPTVMQTTPDGERLDMSEVYQYQGIIRDESCTYRDAWQGYECGGSLQYRMMIIESMDSDTEKRRLSPIALLSDTGYLDLINGPMDHGWCSGYTCQARISTFYTIVATSESYSIYMTGTNPQHTRLHLLQATVEECVHLKIYYSTPSRLDVYLGEQYHAPTNAYIGAQGDQLLYPASPDYEPDVATGNSGDNYYDTVPQFLHVLVCGPNPLDIVEAPVLIISFSLPAMSVDDFFGENVVNNLAIFLGIDPSNIRVPEIIAESRRKRDTANLRFRRDGDVVTVDIVISSPPTELLDTEATETMRVELQDSTDAVVHAVQTGTLGDELNITILSASVVEPVASPDSEAWAEQAEDGDTEPAIIYVPDHLTLQAEGVALHESTPFEEPVAIAVEDAQGTLVTLLRSTANPWQITAELRPGLGDERATLVGDDTIAFRQGVANFSALSISHSGSGYYIDFAVSDPVDFAAFTISAGPFTVSERVLALNIINQPEIVEVSENFTLEAQIVDAVTGAIAENVYWKDHDWDVSVAVTSDAGYSGALSGQVADYEVTEDGFIRITMLELGTQGHAYIEVTVTSTPADYSLTALTTIIQVEGAGYWARQSQSQQTSHVQLTYDGDHAQMLAQGHEQSIFSSLVNALAPSLSDVSLINMASEAGSILISFDVQGLAADLDPAQDVIWSLLQAGSLSFEIEGVSYPALMEMEGDGDPYVVVEEASGGMSTGVLIAIIIVSIVVVVLLVAFLLWFFLVRPNRKTAPDDTESKETQAEKEKTSRRLSVIEPDGKDSTDSPPKEDPIPEKEPEPEPEADVGPDGGAI